MTNAFIELAGRLRSLTSLISDRDDSNGDDASETQKAAKAARALLRNERLFQYRSDALAVDFDKEQESVAGRSFATRTFSYIHAEFNFNSPRYISRLARVSHLVFAPLYIERRCIPDGNPSYDEAKRIGEKMQQTLDWLWGEAIHDSASNRGKRTFRGGKDKIFNYVQELFDFSEPFIATKRAVWEMKKSLMQSLGHGHSARRETDALDIELKAAGLSNRLTNTVEFFWKFDEQERAHFRWTRHSRPYQTYTYIHESRDGVAARSDPFEQTALHAFPAETTQCVFGRFVQGANYLILPVEALLTGSDEALADAGHWASRDDAEKIADLLTPLRTKGMLDEAIVKATRGFLHRCFREEKSGEFQHEFVGFRCMDGRAYVFSNVRNISQDAGSGNDTLQDLFTRTVIVDCGMNGFQRGRLIQNLAEFATERTMALLWIARFRLLHYAFNVIQSRMSLAVSNYHNHKDQRDSVVPESYYRDMVLDNPKHEPERQRQLIIALEFLSSCLTVLNDMIEGGVADRSARTTSSIETLLGKLRSIREEQIAGHQTLSDFLLRRFIPAARVIGRTGERYARLRARINEIADLTEAHLQVEQRDQHRREANHQTWLLRIAEFFGEAALGYYGTSLAADFLESRCAHSAAAGICGWSAFAGHGGFDANAMKACVYGVGVFAVLLLWVFSLVRVGRDIYREYVSSPDAEPSLLRRRISRFMRTVLPSRKSV